MTTIVTAVLVGLVVGVGGGVYAGRWLRTRAYRYADEAGLPERPVGWVPPVVVLTVLAVMLGVTTILARPPAEGGLGRAVGTTVAIGYALIAAVLVVLAAVDIDVRRLPDRFTRVLLPASLVLVVVGGLAGHQPHAVVRAVLAGLALGAFYLVLVVLGRGSAFGLGDAKLAPTIGVLLGFFSWAHVIVGTFLAFLLGAVYGACLVAFTSAGRRATIAFGPHIILGALLLLAVPAIGALR